MLILVFLAVVVVGAVAAAALAAASGGRDPEHSVLGGAGPPLVLVGGGVAAVVLLAMLMGLVGFRGGGGGGDDGEEPEASRPRPPATVPATAEPAEPARRAPAPPDAGPEVADAGPEVAIAAGAPPAVVDRLPGRAVLVVRASGFKPGTGEVSQCGLASGGGRDCANHFPVEFDAGGTARFQYLVSDRVHPGGRCGPGRAPCQVVVSGPGGEPSAWAFTVFGGPAPPPGKVSVEPRTGLSDGDVVTVRASGFPPATPLVAAQCPPGTRIDPAGCGRAVRARTGPDGSAVVRLAVGTGDVGGARCGPRQACSVRVAVEAPLAPVTVPLAFSAGPQAHFSGARLAGGLALAMLFLVLAWRLVRTTDWREPAAAATPEMDRAVLD